MPATSGPDTKVEKVALEGRNKTEVRKATALDFAQPDGGGLEEEFRHNLGSNDDL